MTAALRRAGFLRTAALVPDVDATPPPGWDEEEDGLFNAGFVDGVDGASVGGFFRQMSRGKGCGFPVEGLGLLRGLLVLRRRQAHASGRTMLVVGPLLLHYHQLVGPSSSRRSCGTYTILLPTRTLGARARRGGGGAARGTPSVHEPTPSTSPTPPMTH